MNENDLRINIILSLNRALLGNIKSDVRAICCGWDNLKYFKLKFIQDSEPTSEDYDIISLVLTEFESYFVGKDFFNKVDEEIIDDKRPFGELDMLKLVVYARYEE